MSNIQEVIYQLEQVIRTDTPCGKGWEGTKPGCKRKSKSTSSPPKSASKSSKPSGMSTSKQSSKHKAQKQLEAALDKDPKLKQYIGIMIGKKISDKKVREQTGLSQNELLALGQKARKMFGLSTLDPFREGLKARLQDIYG